MKIRIFHYIDSTKIQGKFKHRVNIPGHHSWLHVLWFFGVGDDGKDGIIHVEVIIHQNAIYQQVMREGTYSYNNVIPQRASTFVLQHSLASIFFPKLSDLVTPEPYHSLSPQIVSIEVLLKVLTDDFLPQNLADKRCARWL